MLLAKVGKAAIAFCFAPPEDQMRHELRFYLCFMTPWSAVICFSAGLTLSESNYQYVLGSLGH